VIGGNKQHDYITKADVSSPTVTAEAVMLTCVIDAQENRDVAVVDIPNAFIQTVVSDEDAEHRVTVRIRGPLVDILVSMAPDVYGPYVSVTKNGQKVLIVECLNAVYGTMVAALLYYKKFVKSLKSQAFKLNPYDGCVANKIVKGKQITICFDVDDCKISHEVPQVIDETIDWLKAKYESIFEDGSGDHHHCNSLQHPPFCSQESYSSVSFLSASSHHDAGRHHPSLQRGIRHLSPSRRETNG